MRFQCAADRLMAIRPVIPPIVVRSAPCLGVISSTIRLITARIAVSGRYAAFSVPLSSTTRRRML
jgi:hypothetical protein